MRAWVQAEHASDQHAQVFVAVAKVSEVLESFSILGKEERLVLCISHHALTGAGLVAQEFVCRAQGSGVQVQAGVQVGMFDGRTEHIVQNQGPQEDLN
jgi:hypothetical protein